MRKSYKIIVNLILAFLLACICVGTTYAWYVNKENLSLQLTGSATSYFSEGDGTQASPFIIANKQHVYNFAYFQNRGDFNDVNPNDSTGLYYFKIDSNVKTIDMEDVVLPPIGNDTYPFKGVFNGSGCTLKNVTITTDKSRLPKSNPSYAKDYAFSLSVGLFGKTASTSQISNFILENPVVEVASSNSLYATSGTKTVGLAIGDVGYKAASIGVKGGKLNVRVSGYTTYNSILGNVKEGASSSVTGGGKPTSGQSIGFGGSLDILSVYQRMYLINQNGWATPQVTVSTDTSSSSHPNKGYALPLMVGNDVDYTDDTYYNTHTSETVNKNNIGYYTGNDTKINAIKTKDRVYASDVTYASDNTTISDIKIWTKRSSTSGSQSDIEVTNIDESIKNDIVKQLNNTVNGEKIFYGLRLNSQVSQNNPVNLSSMTVAGNTYTSTSYIPANAVWFVAQRTGIAKIVLAVAGNGKQGFSLYQVSRDTNSQKDKTNPYNASISGVTVLTEIKDSSGTVIYNADWAREMTENRIYYYEIPVTEGIQAK
jgi:hypothetical protein